VLGLLVLLHHASLRFAAGGCFSVMPGDISWPAGATRGGDKPLAAMVSRVMHASPVRLVEVALHEAKPRFTAAAGA
jgi:hypothetical protein